MRSTLTRAFVYVGLAVSLLPAIAFAQGDCSAGAGPLHTERNVDDERSLIEQVAARESAAFTARHNFTFTQEVTVQTLLDTERGKPIVDGEYQQIADVSYDDQGNRIEHVTYAPQSSLRRVALMPSDLDDIRDFAVFFLTKQELPHYMVRYLGQQHVDELDTYVFEVAPRTIEKNKRYFQGKLWVEMKELDVVKTCGRSVPDVVTDKKRRSQDVHPTFATYREQMDSGYWFPTYSRSDDYLQFPRYSVHIREVIKFRDYHPTIKANGNWQSFDKKK